MIRTRRDAALLVRRSRSTSDGAMIVFFNTIVFANDGAASVDVVGVDGHLAVFVELVHGLLGGVVALEQKPEQCGCDDGRDPDAGYVGGGC